MDRRILAALLVVFVLSGAASAKKVLFYEVSTDKSYQIEDGYTKLVDELRKNNHEVASIEKGELTKEKLESYDILVVQNLNRDLSTSEISSIIWFVLQKGRGLFINGGGSNGNANQLTIPFGVTVDGGTLIDTSDMIPNAKSRSSFVVDRFGDNPSNNILRKGVSKLGFYKGSGLILSGNSWCVVSGNSDTYSDTGSFSAGSMPCVAAASQFGSGLVFTLSDADMLSNKHLGEYNNENFGVNVMDWLSIASDNNFTLSNSTQELQLRIKEWRLQSMQLEQQVDKLTEEKSQLQSSLSRANSQVSSLQQEILDMKSDMIGPFSKSNWAIIILGVCILFAAIAFSRKKTSSVKIKDDDILNELGYELEGGDEEDDDLADLKL